MLTHAKDRNDRKVKKSVSMYFYAFKRSYKRQKVTDTKSRNASHIVFDFLKCRLSCIPQLGSKHGLALFLQSNIFVSNSRIESRY